MYVLYSSAFLCVRIPFFHYLLLKSQHIRYKSWVRTIIKKKNILNKQLKCKKTKQTIAVFISKLAVFLYNETFAGFFLSLVHFPGKPAPFFFTTGFVGESGVVIFSSFSVAGRKFVVFN